MRKQQRQLAKAEEAEAKKFAKKLGLNKRRNKDTLPPSMLEAGFDCTGFTSAFLGDG